MKHIRILICVLFTLLGTVAIGADWRQFRGPGGQGISEEKSLPTEWSAQKNIVWSTKLPGAGTSSPITVGERIFVTCYSGYAQDVKEPGKQEDLKRHVVCLDRKTGKILWSKEFDADLPEHKYQGEGAYHGYSSSTPASDGERLYVFFGKTGVFCFDLDGKQLWKTSVGNKVHEAWGSAASPILYKDMLIVNASSESESMVALDKMTGKEVWKAPGIRETWDTPVLVKVGSSDVELVISTPKRVKGFDPNTGKGLWNAEGVDRYICPSIVAHDGVVYVIGGGHTSLAVKAGGRGDVTKTHTLWREQTGANVSSPIYLDGKLYWTSDGNQVHCQDAETGKFDYSERLTPNSGGMWASPVLADGKLYYVSQRSGTYVVAAKPKFELLAHNVIEDDKSRTNASIAVSDGQLLLRTDQALYCIGKK
jgi:outer membrane protein assembly factor BamB